MARKCWVCNRTEKEHVEADYDPEGQCERADLQLKANAIQTFTLKCPIDATKKPKTEHDYYNVIIVGRVRDVKDLFEYIENQNRFATLTQNS